jgi:hypothetical protein
VPKAGGAPGVGSCVCAEALLAAAAISAVEEKLRKCRREFDMFSLELAL